MLVLVVVVLGVGAMTVILTPIVRFLLDSFLTIDVVFIRSRQVGSNPKQSLNYNHTKDVLTRVVGWSLLY